MGSLKKLKTLSRKGEYEKQLHFSYFTVKNEPVQVPRTGARA
jgi:hypothetical protein